MFAWGPAWSPPGRKEGLFWASVLLSAKWGSPATYHVWFPPAPLLLPGLPPGGQMGRCSGQSSSQSDWEPWPRLVIPTHRAFLVEQARPGTLLECPSEAGPRAALGPGMWLPVPDGPPSPGPAQQLCSHSWVLSGACSAWGGGFPEPPAGLSEGMRSALWPCPPWLPNSPAARTAEAQGGL